MAIPTKEKLAWIRELGKLKDQRFELRLHAEPSANGTAPLTIDIYGKDHVFITYVETDNHPIHIYFRSSKMGQLFNLYYESTWKSKEILIHPKLKNQPAFFNEEKLASLEKLFGKS